MSFLGKVECVFSMVVPFLPRTEFWPNDHQDYAPNFILLNITTTEFTLHVVSNLFRFNHLKTRECGGEG